MEEFDKREWGVGEEGGKAWGGGGDERRREDRVRERLRFCKQGTRERKGGEGKGARWEGEGREGQER